MTGPSRLPPVQVDEVDLCVTARAATRSGRAGMSFLLRLEGRAAVSPGTAHVDYPGFGQFDTRWAEIGRHEVEGSWSGYPRLEDL